MADRATEIMWISLSCINLTCDPCSVADSRRSEIMRFFLRVKPCSRGGSQIQDEGQIHEKQNCVT